MQNIVTATGPEPRTTQFLNEHSTIWPNWIHWPNWIIECGFTLKRVRDMTRTYNHAKYILVKFFFDNVWKFCLTL